MSNHSGSKTVVFLGAGASAADGAPIQSNLLREYFIDGSPEQRDANGISWRGVFQDFFGGFFGICPDMQDDNKTPFPTFEEILGILEIAESQEESFRYLHNASVVLPHRRWTISTIREMLILLIAEVLDRKLQGPSKHHPQLVRSLEHAGVLPDWSFISLNYDILIDNALLALYDDYDLDYAVQFVDNASGWRKPREGKSIKLLKLHGSLNWLYCPTCRTLELTPNEKRICRLKTDPRDCACGRCDTLSVPIIIPPTYFKVLSNLYLRQIWDTAERILQSADKIVFCGYSFPDADVHVRYLLKRMEVNGDNNPEIFIVNEHKDKPEHAKVMEYDRYRRFFRDKPKIHWTKLSFEQFAENPQSIEDPSTWDVIV